MADLASKLEISVDASGVEAGVNKAAKSINSLGATAEAAGNKGSAGLEKMGKAGDETAKKLDAATRNLIANAQRNLAAIEAGVEANGRMSGKFIESLARQRGADINVLRPFIKDLDEAIAKQKIALGQNAQLLSKGPLAGVTTSLGATPFVKPLPSNLTTSLGATAFGEVAAGATKASAAVAAFNKEFDYSARTVKQTTAALRQVPAQLTDIIVSLQGGQAPLTVLLQQGGQLKDVFGGVGPAARALGGYILSLVNPYTLAAAAVVGLGAAYYVTTKRQDEFAKSLILSGNATGTTVSNLTDMAEAISASTGTLGQASDALAKFAADGNVSAENIQKFTQAAVRLENVGGPAVEKVVEQFASLAKDPLQASLKLNESTRFLTRSIYDQIKALQESGQEAKAAAVAQEAYFNTIESRGKALEDRLGNIERLWKTIKEATLGAVNAAAGLVIPNTKSQELRQQMENLKTLEDAVNAARARGGEPTSAALRNLDRQRDIVDGLKQQIQVENTLAGAQAEGNKQLNARLKFEEILKRNQVDKKALLDKEIEVIKNAAAGGIGTQAEIDKAIAGARERFKGPKGAAGVTERALDRSELAFDLSAIKAEADELVRIYSDAERIVSALRAGDLVEEKAYYESRRQFLELTTQAQERALQKEIERLQQEKFTSKDKNQNVKDELDNQRQVAEAEAKLATLRASASSKAVLLNIEEINSIKQKRDALISARQAAEDYLASQQRQEARTLQAFGQGPREAVFAAGINQIDDAFSQQSRELQNLKVLGKLTEQEYADRLAIIKEFQQKSIESFTDYYAKLIEMQGNAALGATSAVKTYIDEAANVAQSTNELVSNSLRGLEDGLTNFLTTGKFKYKEFATSIVADINRIIIKQQLANLLASQLGGGSSSGSNFIGSLFSAILGSKAPSAMSSGAFGIGVSGFAMGGSVERGRIVEVNEGNGPGELFNVGSRQYLLASQSGRVEPQKGTSGANEMAMTVIQNFTLAAPADRRTQTQVAAAAGRGIQTAMARNS